MIVLSVCAFTSLPGLAVSALVIIAASVVARIPPWSLLNGAGPLVALAICVTLFKTFQPGAGLTTPELVIGNRYIPDLYIPNVSAAGFVEGVIAGVRLLVSFAAAALLFATITMRELRRSLAVVETKAAAVIRRGPPAGRLSLAICLMLGFIPRFFEVWEDMNCACEARSCKRGPRRLAIIIPLAAERLMEAAADTALALEARGNSRL
jgi:biotin transport system permease protein